MSGITGPRYCISTACTSSAKVFATAKRLVDTNVVDAALVGGVDTICATTLHGFHALGVLSSIACRPFGENREGMNIGEGGALVLLERGGDGTVALLGAGESSDAHHMSAPHPEGIGAEAAIRAALAEARLDASAIDLVNAHGTGTPQNDSAEGAAIARVLGDRVPVASTKGTRDICSARPARRRRSSPRWRSRTNSFPCRSAPFRAIPRSRSTSSRSHARRSA